MPWKALGRPWGLSGADMISGADIPDIISSLIFISEILIFCKIVVKTLKWPKIPEDSSDFDDFWLELIVMT